MGRLGSSDDSLARLAGPALWREVTLEKEATFEKEVTLGRGVILGRAAALERVAALCMGATLGTGATLGVGAPLGMGAALGVGAALEVAAALGTGVALGEAAASMEGEALGRAAALGVGATLGEGAALEGWALGALAALAREPRVGLREPCLCTCAATALCFAALDTRASFASAVPFAATSLVLGMCVGAVTCAGLEADFALISNDGSSLLSGDEVWLAPPALVSGLVANTGGETARCTGDTADFDFGDEGGDFSVSKSVLSTATQFVPGSANDNLLIVVAKV